MVIGWKIYPYSSIFAYFKVFRVSASVEKLPCRCALLGARESTKVTSHTSGFHRCQVMAVTPSGRLPSVLDNPAGSKTEGTTTEVKDRLIKSLKKACRANRPAFLLQASPWVPYSSTFWPQQHVCIYPVAKPRRNEVGRRWVWGRGGHWDGIKPAYLPWLRENCLDWVWSRDFSISICSLSSTEVDQVFWASLFATGMAFTPESSYQAVCADSTSLSLPRLKFRSCEKGSQPTAEAKKAEGAVRTADGIPIPPNFTGRKTCLSRD